jgi:hypothetical protein
LDSRSWKAADGAYVPLRLNLSRMGFSQAEASPLVMPVIDSSADYTLKSAIGTRLASLSTGAASGVSMFIYSEDPTRFAAYDTVGAYFVGLSLDTVLILDIIFLVEVAPTPANSVLIGIAKPPPRKGNNVFKLYDDLLRELPPGTPVGNNANGDWWRFISKAVDFLSPVISKLGPQGMAVATAANAVKAVGDRVLEQKMMKKVERIERQERENANGIKKIAANTAAPKTIKKMK